VAGSAQAPLPPAAWTLRIQSAKDRTRELAGVIGGRAHLVLAAIRLEIAQRSVFEDLDLAFGIAELLLAVSEQFAAAPIGRQRLLERQAAALHVLDDLFEFGERRFEFQLADGGPALPGAASVSTGCSVFGRGIGKARLKPAKIAY
jgi:hypothetical protein